VLRSRKRSEGRRWIVLQALQIYDAEDPICAMRAAPSIGVLAVPRLDVQDDQRGPLHIPCVDGDGLFNRVRWRFGARSGGRNADVLSVQQSGVRRGIGNAQT